MAYRGEGQPGGQTEGTPLIYDEYPGTDRDDVEQSNDIHIRKQHAPVTVGSPKHVGLVRAMDIDEAPARIDDPPLGVRSLVSARLETIQPEDAGCDKIILRRRPLGGELAGRLAGLEDHTGSGAGPDLLADLMESVRGLLRILDAASAGPGRADDVGFAFLTMEMP